MISQVSHINVAHEPARRNAIPRERSGDGSI